MFERIIKYWNIWKTYSHSHRNQNIDVNFRYRNFKFLYPHVKKALPRYLILLFLLMFSSALSLPKPAITGYIIDKVFVAKDVSKLNFLVLLLLSIILLSEAVSIIKEYFRLRLSQEFTFSIRTKLIKKILQFPLSFFKKFQTGYLVSRIEEVTNLGNFFSGTILSLLENLIRFLGAIFLIIQYNIKLTIISLFILPLFFEISRRSIGAIRGSSLGAIEKTAKVKGKIQDTISGIEVVKSFAKEDRETEEIQSGLRKKLEFDIIQSLFSSFSGRMLGIITGINLLVILWIGGHEIIAGRLTVGQYVAFVSYITFLYGPIQTFALTFLQFQKAIISSNRISSFLSKIGEDEQPGRQYEFKKIKGDICFKNVDFHYGDNKNVLTNISFSIREGEKIAIAGKSGVGKSTLVNLIVGLLDPTQGSVEIDEVDTKIIQLKSLRNRIGIVSQNIFLFNDSILNNIRFSQPDATLEDIIAAAKASGCHDFITDFSQGYNTNAGEVGSRLSGGEKQRISIARCLLKNPDLIIFDEPTSHLDQRSINILISTIMDLFKNKTTLIITHQLNNIQWVDKIIVLDNGRIVQQGKPEDLIEAEGVYKELLKTSQAPY